MKTIVDYLKEHKEYVHDFEGREFKLKLFTSVIMIVCNNNTYEIDANDESNDYIQQLLELHNIEIRFCEECGKPFDAGYVADGGFWYSCKDCFNEAMDKCYGKGKWRGTDKEGDYGGFYECLNDDGEWEDTSVYYTEWY